MFLACFWWWSCLAKINIVLGKWIHLDFIEYQAIFTALFCRNFKFQIELPLVSCEREVKEVAGNESLCKAAAFVSKEQPDESGNPSMVRTAMNPFVSREKRKLRAISFPACLRTQWQENLAASFQIPKSTLSFPATRSNEHWPLNNLITQCQFLFWLMKLIFWMFPNAKPPPYSNQPIKTDTLPQLSQ